MSKGDIEEKHEALKQYLARLKSVAVAYSAGVDSTLLLAVAHEVLEDDAVAFTAVSPSNPQRETDEATEFCATRGIRHVRFEIDELSEIEGFSHNPKDRCYLCKGHLFKKITGLARAEGCDFVVEGSNVDDVGDYRPGRRALSELGILSPLLECGFTKSDVRELSRELGLPTWEKPSFACLYSRFAYGDEITRKKLEQVDESEAWLIGRGYRTVRVRVGGVDGEIARIEVAPADIARIAEAASREAVVKKLKEIGFTYVALDLQGYRTGSMNETLG